MGINQSVRKTVLVSKPSFSEDNFRHPPQDLVNHSSVIDHRGRLWVYGGQRASSTDLVSAYNDELRYYDIESNEWRIVFFTGESPGIRLKHKLYAQPLFNKLHLFAGMDGDGKPLADILSLDLETLASYKEENAVVEPSDSGDAVGFIDVDRARFNIIYEPFNMFSMCSVIFDDVQKVKPRGEMPEFPLRPDNMIVSGRLAYFFGEENDVVKVYQLHLDTFLWTKNTTKGDNPACFGHYTVSSFGARVILFGALDDAEHKKRWFNVRHQKKHCHCFFLDLETMTWTKSRKSFAWRQGHTASLYESELYILGGHPESSKETLIKLTFTDDAVLDDPMSVTWGELMGSGSYGEVFNGRYQNEDVALKRFKNQEILKMDGMKEILERYIKVHKATHHPSIVRLIKANLQVDNTFVITEKAPKGNLCRLLKAKQKIAFKDILEYTLSISDAIGHLHNTVPSVIHGHLSCENVLVFNGHKLKVSDFGLSKVRKASKDGLYQERAAFLAPETLAAIQDGEDLRTTTSDVYAIGILMWSMLHRNSSPFGKDDSFPTVMEKVLDNEERPEIADITSLPCYSPEDEDDIKDYIYLMKKCWSEKPKRRPKAGEVSFGLKWIMRDFEDNHFHQDVWGPVMHGSLAENPQVWNMHVKETPTPSMASQ